MINTMFLLSAQVGREIVEKTKIDSSSVTISVELVLSIIAITISIASPIFEWLWNKAIHRKDLEADFYKDIFEEYLINAIPEARNLIHYNNEILNGTDKLVDVLNELRRNILFFKFWNKKYYDELHKLLQDLEDLLILRTGHMSSDEFVDFHTEVDKRIRIIYEKIMSEYVGKGKK